MNNKGLMVIGIGVILLGIGLILLAALARTTTEETIARPSVVTGDTGTVLVVGPAAAIEFAVPDPDAGLGQAGWSPGDPGFVTNTVELTLRETSGREVCVESIMWRLYDANGTQRATGIKYMSTTIAANGTASASISITLDEGAANQIDDASGDPDNFSGSGAFTFSASGRDIKNDVPINDIDGSTDMTVTGA